MSTSTQLEKSQGSSDADNEERKLYRKLKKWQTRMLRLHAGKEGDALSGDLLIADMVEFDGLVLHDEEVLIQYEALS